MPDAWPILRPKRENFMLFDATEGTTQKIIARNHQYLGVNRVIDRLTSADPKVRAEVAAGAAEVDAHAMVVSPQIKQAPRELTAVVDKHPARRAQLGRQSIADRHHAIGAHAGGRFNRQRFTSEDIHHGQNA